MTGVKLKRNLGKFERWVSRDVRMEKCWVSRDVQREEWWVSRDVRRGGWWVSRDVQREEWWVSRDVHRGEWLLCSVKQDISKETQTSILIVPLFAGSSLMPSTVK